MNFLTRILIVAVADIAVYGVGTFLNAYLFKSELMVYIINSIIYLITAFGVFSGSIPKAKKMFHYNPPKDAKDGLKAALQKEINQFDYACSNEQGGISDGQEFLLVTSQGESVTIIISATIAKINNKRAKDYVRNLKDTKIAQAFEKLCKRNQFDSSKDELTYKKEISLHFEYELKEGEIAKIISELVNENHLVHTQYLVSNKDSIIVKK